MTVAELEVELSAKLVAEAAAHAAYDQAIADRMSIEIQLVEARRAEMEQV